jgi:hypothetical protein
MLGIFLGQIEIVEKELSDSEDICSFVDNRKKNYIFAHEYESPCLDELSKGIDIVVSVRVDQNMHTV